jgi:nucleoside-triphosphatase THEP1
LPYDIIAESMPLTVRRDNKKIGITVHKTESGKNYVVAVNYSDKAQTTDYTLNDGKFKKAIHGKVSENNITIEPYGIAVFEVQ